ARAGHRQGGGASAGQSATLQWPTWRAISGTLPRATPVIARRRPRPILESSAGAVANRVWRHVPLPTDVGRRRSARFADGFFPDSRRAKHREAPRGTREVAGAPARVHQTARRRRWLV